MKILVVDDSRVMRQIVTRTLRQAGFAGLELIEAGDGTEALTLLAEQSVDAVLSDWNMPQMNGIDLLRHLRGNGNTVPFAFVTSESSEAMVNTAMEAGAMCVIGKPFTPETFAEHLNAVLV